MCFVCCVAAFFSVHVLPLAFPGCCRHSTAVLSLAVLITEQIRKLILEISNG